MLAGVSLFVSSLWLLDLHPAQAVARVMPQEARATLGSAVVASMAKNRKVCETPASRAALDRLTQRLAAAASDKPLHARVVLLDWSLVNAFAVPGGQIILTRGLVQRAGSSDEVAGVLAHELGHTLELHPEAGIIRALGLAAATQLAFAGSQGTVSNIGLRPDAAALHAHRRARGRRACPAHAQGRRHLGQGLRRFLRAPGGQEARRGDRQERHPI